MKKSFYRLAIVAFTSAICAVLLFFIFDYSNITEKHGGFKEIIKENKAVNMLKSLMEFSFEYGDLDEDIFDNYESGEFISEYVEFSKVSLKFDNVRVRVEKSGEYEIILLSDTKADLSESVSVDKGDGKFNIKQKDNYNFGVILRTPNPQSLKIKLNAINGGFDSYYSLDSFEADIVNGEVMISAEESFPINIDSDNGLVKLDILDYDATIKIKNINGSVNIFDESSLNSGKNGTVEKVIGAGRDLILIDNINGIIDIK
ncbi:MAG: hypothetical protein Q4D95_02550 [Peptoniphilus sp.]|nr:hypothetical protein [Peptoniphilus sp.]